MYRWVWERLPGPTAARLVVAALLAVAAVAFLVLVVFPWLELLLPFTEVNVGIVGPPPSGLLCSEYYLSAFGIAAEQ